MKKTILFGSLFISVMVFSGCTTRYVNTGVCQDSYRNLNVGTRVNVLRQNVKTNCQMDENAPIAPYIDYY